MARKLRQSKVLRLTTGNEVMHFLSSFSEGDYEFDETGVETAVISELTPSLAEYLLDNRTRNRAPDPKHVTVLASIMASDGFIPALDPLRVNRFGQAIDFMHRGLAVIASGSVLKNVPLFVLADDRAMTALDTDQKARNLRNVYDIRGDKPIPNCILSGLNLEVNDFKANRTGTQARDHLVNVYDQLDIMMMLYKINAKATGGFLAAAARCARVDREKAEWFFSRAIMTPHKYDELLPEEKPSEVTLIRNHLNQHITHKVRGHQRLHMDAAKSIYCFERWYSGNGTTQMRCPKDENGRLMLTPIGRKEFQASEMNGILKADQELRGRTTKIVREWVKREAGKKAA